MDSRKVLKALAILICIAGFLWQLSLVSDEYFSESTYITLGSEIFNELKMPVVTICVHEGMKKQGAFIHVEDFIANSFSLDEILAKPIDTDKIKVRGTPSMVLGMCYTLEVIKPVDASSGIKVSLNTTLNYLVYIDEPGEEYWITIGFDPSGAESAYIHAKNNDNIGMAKLKITKVSQTLLQRYLPGMEVNVITSIFRA